MPDLALPSGLLPDLCLDRAKRFRQRAEAGNIAVSSESDRPCRLAGALRMRPGWWAALLIERPGSAAGIGGSRARSPAQGGGLIRRLSRAASVAKRLQRWPGQVCGGHPSPHTDGVAPGGSRAVQPACSPPGVPSRPASNTTGGAGNLM